jgi:hypothetical protein
VTNSEIHSQRETVTTQPLPDPCGVTYATPTPPPKQPEAKNSSSSSSISLSPITPQPSSTLCSYPQSPSTLLAFDPIRFQAAATLLYTAPAISTLKSTFVLGDKLGAKATNKSELEHKQTQWFPRWLISAFEAYRYVEFAPPAAQQAKPVL